MVVCFCRYVHDMYNSLSVFYWYTDNDVCTYHSPNRWLFSVVNSDKKFLSHPFPLPAQNKQNAIASYEQHNQLVRDTIPASQLLEYNVRQGWEPLCQFLEIPDVDCPSSKDIPFPKSNSARAVKWQSYSAFIGPLILTVVILLSIFTFAFRKIMGMPVITWCLSLGRRSQKRVKRS